MGKNSLGEFEELVMLTIAILYPEAYGVAIREEIAARTGRGASIGALQTALKRLEGKGYLESEMGEATAVRGGKRKRYYTVSAVGSQVLRETRELRTSLWKAIPELGLKITG